MAQVIDLNSRREETSNPGECPCVGCEKEFLVPHESCDRGREWAVKFAAYFGRLCS